VVVQTPTPVCPKPPPSRPNPLNSNIFAVLLGPLRAVTYVLLHGGLAAALGSMWAAGWSWSASVLAGAALRMSGQLGYLLLSSVTMNENLFAVMLANVHNLLVRIAAGRRAGG
jgi:hypothetical protein